MWSTKHDQETLYQPLLKKWTSTHPLPAVWKRICDSNIIKPFPLQETSSRRLWCSHHLAPPPIMIGGAGVTSNVKYEAQQETKYQTIPLMTSWPVNTAETQVESCTKASPPGLRIVWFLQWKRALRPFKERRTFWRGNRRSLRTTADIRSTFHEEHFTESSGPRGGSLAATGDDHFVSLLCRSIGRHKYRR